MLRVPPHYKYPFPFTSISHTKISSQTTMAMKLSILLLVALSLLLVPSHCNTRIDEGQESPEKWLSKCFASCGRPGQLHQGQFSECEKQCVQQYEEIKELPRPGTDNGSCKYNPCYRVCRAAGGSKDSCAKRCNCTQLSKTDNGSCKYNPCYRVCRAAGGSKDSCANRCNCTQLSHIDMVTNE